MSRSPLLLAVAALLAQPCLAAVTFDWVYVGNAGNAPDNTGFGAVSYNYAIAKYEVTNSQYTQFLNAVATTDSFALYNVNMGSNVRGGITRSGSPGSYTYETKANMANKPVNYVSYFDAMRFTNWLHNGQGVGDTETGVYAISNGLNEVRSTGAKYWLPSENEWYKAAYHDASAGVAGLYFNYAAGGDSGPAHAAPWDNPAGANYSNSVGNLTDVGAYTAAASPYGTYDQNGNVWEVNEAVIFSTSRGARGGSWNSGDLRADFRLNVSPLNESPSAGFRIATIPEPTSLALATMLFSGLGFVRRRG